MARAIYVVPESNFGELTTSTRITDVATLLSATAYRWLPERTPEDVGPGRSIAAVTGGGGRSGRGAGRPQRFQDTYVDGSGTYRPVAGGTFSFSTEVCMPGAGVAWSTTPVYHLLRTRYAIDTPALASDTVTGVSSSRLTPATPADWQTGDMAVCRLNGLDFAFVVTGRNGNDLLITPGLPSTVAGGTTVRLCHRLYNKPGSEGASVTIVDHGFETLWLGTGARLGDHTFKRSPDGRLLLEGDLMITQWVGNHSSVNPFSALDAEPAGGPAMANGMQWRVSGDYKGISGGYTTAPWYGSGASLDYVDPVVTVTVGTASIRNNRNPQGVGRMATGDVSAVLESKLVTYSGNYNEDGGKRALRVHSMCAGPASAAGQGVVLFAGGAQVDPETVPDFVELQTTHDDQTLRFLTTVNGQGVDEAPGTGTATSDAALWSWQIGLVMPS